jgi:hypothetical protein
MVYVLANDPQDVILLGVAGGATLFPAVRATQRRMMKGRLCRSAGRQLAFGFRYGGA